MRVTDLGGNTATSTLTVILAVTGLPPVADASRDSDVNTLTLPIGTTTVVLDGSDSVANAVPATLTYLWQLYNPPAGVLLTGADTATPTLDLSGVTGITAPAQVNINLLVTNVRGGLDTDTFYVLLLPLSTANAGVDQSVRAGTEVTLDGSASRSGSSGDATLTYRWTQTAGPTVSLATPVSAMRTFTAPDVTAQTTLTFSLDVENSVSALQTDTVNITVMPNAAPVAMAGADQRAPAGTLVTLTGSATDSDDGAGLTYQWTQLSATGAIVTLTADANTGTATFTAPATVGTSATLRFRLIATDPHGKSSAPDEVIVTVDAALVLSFVDATGAAVTDLTLTEDGGAQTFRVKAETSSGAVFNAAQTVTVALLPSMDAGVVGVTSSTPSPTIVIPANASEGTGAFTLTPTDNTIDELDNTVTVSATLADFTINTLTFPLTDDDQTPTGFTLTIAGQAEVTEYGGAQTLMLTVGVIGATQFRADQTVAVRLTGVEGSPSVDLEPFEQVNIVVPAGAAASAPTAVTLTPVNDTRTEGNEEFELFTASGATARFTLIDDDVALRLLVDTNLNLDGIQNTVREDVGRVPVRVTAIALGRVLTPTTLTVNFGAPDSTALEGKDFAAGSLELTFAAGGAGRVRTTHFLTVLDDQISEGDETIHVSATLGQRDIERATIIIEDNETGPVLGPDVTILRINPTQVNADSGTQTVTLETSSIMTPLEDRVITLTVGDADSNGVFHQPLTPFVVTLPEGQKSVSTPFEITILESSLRGSIPIVGTSSTGGEVRGTSIRVIEDITDILSRSVVTALTADVTTLAEGTTTAVTVTATLATAAPMQLEIPVEIGGNSWAAGSVTTVGDPVLVFAPNALTSTVTVMVSVQEDNIFYGENASASINLDGVALRVTRYIAVTDNDAAPTAISLAVSPATVAETAGPTLMQVMATVQGSTRFGGPRTVQVTLPTSPDYDAVPTIDVLVRHGADSGLASFTLNPVDDRMAESGGTEVITVFGALAGVTGVTVNPATFTLTDAVDATSLRLQVDTPTVAEEGGAQTITVTVITETGTSEEGTFSGDATLTLTVGAAGDTATDVADYGATFAGGANTITLSRGDTRATTTFTLTPADDTIDEASQERLTVTGVLTGSTIIPVNPATIFVVDDDAAPTGITLSTSPPSVTEGNSDQTETVMITATVAGDTQFADARTVAVTVAGATATEGADYTVTPSAFNIPIPAGMSSGTGVVMLTLKGDLLDEGNETLTVSGTLAGAAPDFVSPATLILIDNDVPTEITLTVAPATLAEDGVSQTFTVTATVSGDLRFSRPRTLIVTVGSDSDTATPDEDYKIASRTFPLEIAAGSASASADFRLNAVPDTLVEGDETFTVNGMLTEVTVTPATVTLTDNDTEPTAVEVSLIPERVTEGAGATTVTVRAVPVGESTFSTAQTLTVMVGDGAGPTGALQGNGDYSLTDLTTGEFTLEFPANQNLAEGAFTLTPRVEDTIDQPDRTLQVQVSSSLSAVTVNGSALDLTIADNDDTPTGFTLTLDTATVTEGAAPAPVMVTATLDGSTSFSEARTVAIAITGATAIKGPDGEAPAFPNDFTATDFAVVIPAGTASGTGSFTLQSADDLVDEADETLTVSGTATGLTQSNSAPEITIEDNDAPPTGITLSANPATVTESDNTASVTLTATLQGGTRYGAPRTVTVTVGNTGDTATGDADYIGPLTFPVVIPANAATGARTIGLTLRDDDAVETDEQISISGAVAGEAADFVTGATLTLEDDGDQALANIALTLSPTSVSEGGGSQMVRVIATTADNLPNTAATAVLVTVAGATASSTDFAAVHDFTIALPANAISAANTFRLAPITDYSNEPAETITVSGTAPGRTVNSATLSLTNQPVPASITLSAVPVRVREGPVPGAISTGFTFFQALEITATVDGNVRFARDETVRVTATDNSARRGNDFVFPRKVDIRIDAATGVGTQTFLLHAIEDDVTEMVETVMLTGDFRNDPAFTVNAAAVNIADPLFTLADRIPDRTFTRNRAISAVILPAATGDPGTINYTLTNTANLPAGLNYTSGTRTISGTPTAVTTGAPPSFTWTATDTTGPTASMTFTITVIEPIDQDIAPIFTIASVPDQTYTQSAAIRELVLPDATAGNGDISYTLTGTLPAGLNYIEARRTISGTPTAATTGAPPSFTWTAMDGDANSATSDTVSLMFSITVDGEDTAPAFGTATITAQTFMQDTAVDLTLPIATGGNGAITYALTPAIPGLTFDPATRVLSGTPTTIAAATDYTYTAADSDENNAGSDTATLMFSITVNMAGTAPSFGTATDESRTYIAGLAIEPLTLPVATGGDGAITYTLTGPSNAALNTAVPGLTFDAATRTLSGRPTTVAVSTDLTYTAGDTDGSAPGTDEVTLTLSITIEAGTSTAPPTFDGATVSPQAYLVGTAITSLTLPVATGGTGAITYTLTPAIPGLTFIPATRVLSGTPNTQASATMYTYTATDGEMNTAILTITITINDPPAPGTDTAPTFSGATISPQTFTIGTMVDLTLPEATGGNGAIVYTLTPVTPAGVNFDAATRVLSGTPNTQASATMYTYTAGDTDGSAAGTDEATLTFTIAVNAAAATVPTFGDATIGDLTYAIGAAVDLTLPVATGGVSATLFYAVDPAPPAGLAFNTGTRVLSGMPTTAGFTMHTYVARDTFGNNDTLMFTITITDPDAPDTAPTFGTETVAAQTFTIDTAVNLTLPRATGGNGVITYTLTPATPTGVNFDAATLVLSGTPSTVAGATTYTYTAGDTDGSAAGTDEVSLTFTIAVNAPAAVRPVFFQVASSVFNNYDEGGTAVGGPTTFFAEAGTETVVLTLTGADAAFFSITQAGALSFNPAPDYEMPRGMAPSSSNTNTYRVTVLATASPGGLTQGQAVEVRVVDVVNEENTAPAFPGGTSVTIPTFTVGQMIDTLTLPVATGGNGALTYTLTGALPAGLTFNAAARPPTLTGTPTSTTVAPVYMYVANDGDDDMTVGDTARLSLSITVNAAPAGTGPAFAAGTTVPAQAYFAGTAIMAVTLPVATGGTGTLTYTLTPAIPGLTLNPTSRVLTGTPTTVAGATMHTYTATDGDMNTATLMFSITIDAADTAPAFAVTSITAQTYRVNTAITALTLPVATGGNGTITYTLAPAIPGLTLNPTSRVLTGTPTTVAGATDYTYTAADGDGNEAGTDTATLTFNITVTQAPPTAIRLSVNPAEVTESSAATDITVTATLIGGSYSTAQTITVMSTGGSATAGTDYTAVTGTTLTIDADETSGSVDIMFTAGVDTNAEPGGETVLITGTPVSGIMVSPATLTINDYTLAVNAGDDQTVAPGSTITLTGEVTGSTDTTAAWVLSDSAAARAALVAAGLMPAEATTEVARLTTALGAITTSGGTLTAPAVNLGLTDPVELAFTLMATDNTPPAGQTAATAMDTVTITVVEDTTPAFAAGASISAQIYTVDTAITPLTLPAVTGGEGDITYALTPALPGGLNFDAATRVLSGTPTTAAATRTFTYAASDRDDDIVTLTFTITVTGLGVDAITTTALNEAILPEVTRALVNSTSSSITRRVGQAVGSIPTVGSFNLAGQQMGGERNLASALRTHGETMSADSRDIKEILAGSEFVLPLNATAGSVASSMAFWGSGEYRDFSGESDDLDWDGDLTGFQLGLDARLRNNLLVGVAVSMLETDVDYEDDTGILGKGDYELDLTSAHPYIGWRADELDLWATVGYGTGDLEITPDNGGSTPITDDFDVNLLTVGGGGSGMLWQDDATTLRLKGEVSQTTLEVEGGDDNDFAEQEIDATSLRVALEATRSRRLAGGGIFEPSVEVAARYDGGDGETGGGAEVGGALRYRNPATGLTADGRIRALIGQGGSYEEWGISGTVRVAPGTDGQGLSFSLSPGYGDNGSGIQELWRHGLVDETSTATTDDYAMKLDARVGYGFGFTLNEHHGILTPYSELTYGTTDSYRMGLNWAAGERFDLTLLGERREPTTNPAEHAVLLKGEVRF